MNLNDAQKQQVAQWVAEGLKISEIQKRVETELGLRMTYMEVRFLLDDLRVMPQDQTPPPDPALTKKPANAADTTDPESAEEALPAEQSSPGVGRVKVVVDQIARAGAVVSGSVTFSDGQSGTWYLDQMGRLGLAPTEKAYRPAALDVEEFQMQLQQELAKLGY